MKLQHKFLLYIIHPLVIEVFIKAMFGPLENLELWSVYMYACVCTACLCVCVCVCVCVLVCKLIVVGLSQKT